MNTREKYEVLLKFVVDNMDHAGSWGEDSSYIRGKEDQQDVVADYAHEALEKIGIDPNLQYVELREAVEAEVATVPRDRALTKEDRYYPRGRYGSNY